MMGRFLEHVANIPLELKQLSQWCVSLPDKSPIYANASGLHRAKTNNASTWMSFDTACHIASWLNTDANVLSIREQMTLLDWQGELGEFGIGFMCSDNDPYAIIDLDVKNAINAPNNPEKWTTATTLDVYRRMIDYFTSYTEYSPSGLGYHIIVKAVVGEGKNRDGTELYDRGRFMRTTGNVVLNLPIVEAQEGVNMMLAEMENSRKDKGIKIDAGGEEVLEDRELFEMAMNAQNGEKFNELCKASACVGAGKNKIDGSYIQLGYPSQSHADLALMSIFAFYSENNEQCRRLFRMTNLGKREKAIKNDVYLNRTLGIIRGRQKNEVDLTEFIKSVSAETLKKLEAGEEVSEVILTAPAIETPEGEESPITKEGSIPWPPGFAGELAKFMYLSAMRPVPEVAVVAAIGLLAGICGKAFHIPQSGLNMYVTLVARSGVGKEGMHSGIANLMGAVRDTVPASMSFVTYDEFVSGPALSKFVAENQSFVQVSGEWGRRVKRMAQQDDRDGALTSLRTTMTNLYQKSGPQSIVGGMGYSNKDNNVASVSGVAYSMIGETTPGTFYESLTESMMEDGFMSRFLVIEYNGSRPQLNTKAITAPWPELLEGLSQLCTQALTIIGRHTSQPVASDPEASAILNEFNELCDKRINANDDEARRQTWNRAHLKACRLASLVAVADNWLNPIVKKEHAEWAMEVIMRDVDLFTRRLDGGDIGKGDMVQSAKLISVIKEYFIEKNGRKYGAPDHLRAAGIVTRSFMQVRVSRVSAFYKHPIGVNHALDRTIQSLMDNGYIIEVPKAEAANQYKYSGKCYRVLDLPGI